MMQGFPEIVVGGVLVAPFVAYAAAALVVYLLLRPVFRFVGAYRLFADSPIAEVCVYVCLLALLIVLF